MANWAVRVGPNVSGENDGIVNGNSAAFYLEFGSGSPVVEVSADGGKSWKSIPANQGIKVNGNNMVQWRYSADGASFKLLMSPA